MTNFVHKVYQQTIHTDYLHNARFIHVSTNSFSIQYIISPGSIKPTVITFISFQSRGTSYVFCAPINLEYSHSVTLVKLGTPHTHNFKHYRKYNIHTQHTYF